MNSGSYFEKNGKRRFRNSVGLNKFLDLRLVGIC